MLIRIFALAVLLTAASASSILLYGAVITVNAPPNYTVASIVAITPPVLTTGWLSALPTSTTAAIPITANEWGLVCAADRSVCTFPNLLGRTGDAPTPFSFLVQTAEDSTHYFVASDNNVLVPACHTPPASPTAPCTPQQQQQQQQQQTHPRTAFFTSATVAAVVAACAIAGLVLDVLVLDNTTRRVRMVGVTLLGCIFVAAALLVSYAHLSAFPTAPRIIGVSGPSALIARGAVLVADASLLDAQQQLVNYTNALPDHSVAFQAYNEVWQLATLDASPNTTATAIAGRMALAAARNASIAQLELDLTNVAAAAQSAGAALASALNPLPSTATLTGRIAAAWTLANATDAELVALEATVATALSYNADVACPLGYWGSAVDSSCTACACPYWLCSRTNGTCSCGCPGGGCVAGSYTECACTTGYEASCGGVSQCDPARGTLLANYTHCDPTVPCTAGYVGADCDTLVTCNTANALAPLPTYPGDAPTCLAGCRENFAGANCEQYVPATSMENVGDDDGCVFRSDLLAPGIDNCCTPLCDPTFYVCLTNGACEFRDWSAWRPSTVEALGCEPCTSSSDNMVLVAAVVSPAVPNVTLSASTALCSTPVTAAQAACAVGFPSQDPNWPLLHVHMIPLTAGMQYSRGVFTPQTFYAAPVNATVVGYVGSGPGLTTLDMP